MSDLIVVCDACVLYPAPLRDLIMHAALVGLYQPRWSNEIHDEWIENLLDNRPDLSLEQLHRTRDLMNKAIPGALVTDYEHNIQNIELPDPDDRHVVAAAIEAQAQLILTFNTKHFPLAALSDYDIEKCRPDTFFTRLFDEEPLKVVSAIQKQRAALKNPPHTVPELLEALERQGLTHLVQQLASVADLL